MPETSWPDRPFHHAELPALRIREARLRAAINDGRIRPVVRGVFVAASAPDSPEARARAVGIAVRPHHVVTDRTAAWLWGVNTFSPAELAAGPAVETCALRWRQPTKLAGVDGRTRELRPEDVTELHGVRVTTPLRTALDLGCHLRRREAYAAMNDLARAHGLVRRDLERELGRFRGRRGVVQLRELVGVLEPRVESARESWTLLALVDANLPLPEPQVWVEVDGVERFRLDFAYREQRVAIEYDGEEHHARTPEQRAYDEERRARLREEGWTVFVVRRGDFTGDRLYEWLGQVREALVPTYSSRRW